MTTPAPAAAVPLKPSLKRTFDQMQTVTTPSAAKMRRLAQVSMISMQAGQWFANGQLPANEGGATNALGGAASAAADAENAVRRIAGPPQFAFPIPNISALMDDDDDDETEEFSSSDGASDLDDDEELKPLNFQKFSRTNSVVTLSPSACATDNKQGSTRVLTREGSGPQKRALQRSSIASESTPALKLLAPPEKATTPKPSAPATSEDPRVKPDDFLKQKMLKEAGVNVETIPSAKLKDFFVPVSEKTIEGYDMELVKKVREEDVGGLRELMKAGRNMQCCNRFGESIVHMAARRGSLPVLEFLFNEAKVNAKVCCDSGRTPLHDACWTSTPNLGVARLLLDRCPDLLYITDNRSFTPLNYARHSHWESWCDFLGKCSVEKLTAKELWKSSATAGNAGAASNEEPLATVG